MWSFRSILLAAGIISLIGCGDIGMTLDGDDVGDVGSGRDGGAPAQDSGLGNPVDIGGAPDLDGRQPNHLWIGGACSSTNDCNYDDATCLSEADGFVGGVCSLACDLYCPDRDGENSVTFCVAGEDGGTCLSRCDTTLYPGGGCRTGYACRVTPRNTQPDTQQGVCVPSDWEAPTADTACLEDLDRRGVSWTHWNYATEVADNGLTCRVGDPIVVAPVINGVEYRYFSRDNGTAMRMSCDLALALDRLSAVLKTYGINQVLHIGTFNCRGIAGSDSLSQHGLGLAIDLYGFVDSNGQDYILERDWEHETDNPVGPEAQLLYEVAQSMYSERIFNIVLTPNYNDGHDNHFHVDLKAGSRFLGAVNDPGYLGAEPELWQRCQND